MKRLILIVVILVVLILTVVLIVYFSKPKGYVTHQEGRGIERRNDFYAKGGELSCKTETEEEAEEIAAAYGIELVNWVDGTAVFHTEESPVEVQRRGMMEHLPDLQVNYVYHTN